MTTSLTQKIILLISGATAVGIGAAILAVPIAFHATNGIALGDNTSLLSEIRAPGGALLTMGLFMLAGLLRQRLAGFSLAVGAAVFLSYGLSRCIAIAVDGWPEQGLVAAAVVAGIRTGIAVDIVLDGAVVADLAGDGKAEFKRTGRRRRGEDRGE